MAKEWILSITVSSEIELDFTENFPIEKIIGDITVLGESRADTQSNCGDH